MNQDFLQLVSMPLEVLGVFLAMLEVFSPSRAERVTAKIVAIAADMLGFIGGIVVIVTLGLTEAKVWQRALVIGGLFAMLAAFSLIGNLPELLPRLATLWIGSTLLVIVTYTIVFGIFKLVRHLFPDRVLGIIGVLTASLGLSIEAVQYIDVLQAIKITPGADEVDPAGWLLVFFYSAMVLCFVSLLWIAFFDDEENAADDRE